MALTIALLGPGIPTPLYIIYQGQLHFSNAVLTAIYSMYAAGTMMALFLIAPQSDRIGRKPILFAGIGLSLVSTIAFLPTQNVYLLLFARFLSGLSVGAMISPATAALTELEPTGDMRRPAIVSGAASTGGIGLGALLSGFLAQYGPWPTLLPYVVYLAITFVIIALMFIVPETVAHVRIGPEGVPSFGVPRGIRRQFALCAITAFTATSMLGLFTALAPSFLNLELQVSNRAISGTLIFVLFSCVALVQIFARRQMPGRVQIGGLVGIVISLPVFIGSLALSSWEVFGLGVLLAGVSGGLAFSGSLSIANALAPVEHRGGVLAVFFTVMYLGLIVPVVSVGVLSDSIGLYSAAAWFSLVDVLLSLGLLIGLFRMRGPTS